MVVFMVTGAAEYTREADPEVWRRYLTVALDGLRAKGKDATPMPHKALGIVQMTECMGHWRR